LAEWLEISPKQHKNRWQMYYIIAHWCGGCCFWNPIELLDLNQTGN